MENLRSERQSDRQRGRLDRPCPQGMGHMVRSPRWLVSGAIHDTHVCDSSRPMLVAKVRAVRANSEKSKSELSGKVR